MEALVPRSPVDVNNSNDDVGSTDPQDAAGGWKRFGKGSFGRQESSRPATFLPHHDSTVKGVTLLEFERRVVFQAIPTNDVRQPAHGAVLNSGFRAGSGAALGLQFVDAQSR